MNLEAFTGEISVVRGQYLRELTSQGVAIGGHTRFKVNEWVIQQPPYSASMFKMWDSETANAMEHRPIQTRIASQVVSASREFQTQRLAHCLTLWKSGTIRRHKLCENIAFSAIC